MRILKSALYVGFCLVAFVCCGGSAFGAESASADGAGFSAALVIPEAQILLDGEQLVAQREADHADPVAVARRTDSRSRFKHLNARAAIKLAGEAFPRVVNQSDGGVPSLPSGEKILRYDTPHAATVSLPGGHHAVIESLQPIAIAGGHGHFTPINLGLHPSAGGYSPILDSAGIRIPAHLSSGVGMANGGVSLTPVDPNGRPLGGSNGTLLGASVVYANTQTDTDTLAKPSTDGFAIDSLLRSVDSPTTLYFKVGMPAGSRLVAATGGLGDARVRLYGRTIATVAPPTAQDAQGTSVPVRLSVVGATLVVSVDSHLSSYAYPIEVDPHVFDEEFQIPAGEEQSTATNWRYHEEPANKFEHYPSFGYVMTTNGTAITEGEHDEFRYGAHGQASVAYIEEESSAASSETAGSITKMEFAHESTIENQVTLAGPSQGYSNVKTALGNQWNEAEKNYRGIYNENLVRIMQTATKAAPKESGFWFELKKAWVSIYQEKGPEASFNKSTSTIAEAGARQNVLYGGGGWFGQSNGAVEVITKDPGMGVASITIKDLTLGPTGTHWSFTESLYPGRCTGVWCPQEAKAHFTYSPEMAEGANTFEVCAEQQSHTSACATTTVNVDNTAPRAIKLNGMAETGAELSAAPHQITVEATDGTKPTPSSGIKSIAVSIDGKEVGTPSGTCALGECTASRTLTINGEGLGVGEHKLVVIATDNANKGFEGKYTYAIRKATPMPLGPGTVDPVSGQLTLSATDTDVAGVGGVTRTYMSRALSTGLEGPLGPQWSIAAGSGATLKLLPNGNAELRSLTGGLTTYASDKKGGFIAPKGDENLTLESKEKEVGKGITEYLLKNPTAGTTTQFILPAAAHVWVVGASEGTTAAQTTLYSYSTDERPTEYGLPTGTNPQAVAAGPDGNLWVTQPLSDTIDKVTPAGATTSYKLTTPFVCPNYITPGPAGEEALWFTDNCDHQIGRITTTGITTAYNFPSSTELQGIVAGPDGNMWFAMELVNKIGKMTTSGAVSEYNLPTGSHPRGITVGPDGKLWFVDAGTSKVGSITTAGAINETALPPSSEPNSIASGPDGNLWFVDKATNKAGKITTAGAITEYALPASSAPRTIASGPGGSLWYTNYGTAKVGKITTSGAITEYALPTGSQPFGIAQGSDANVWYAAYGTNKVGVLTPIVKPAEVLGPVPSGVSCGKNPQEVKLEELKAGCRALTFTYTEAGKTTATGEASSAWGEYERDLAKVSLTAYNPVTKAMQTTVVSQYSYDSGGRLRAQWDPRISPALKRTYGYDPEGHVTAFSTPGQEPWAFTYGTVAGDPGTGRLMKLMRPLASVALWNGEVAKNTELPAITGTPSLTARLAVSVGKWTGGPVAYSYQWKDCNSEGSGCTAIAGATNPNYTVTTSDAGHTLVAQVGAISGGGTVVASSPARAVTAPTYSSEIAPSGTGAGQLKTPWGVTTDTSGNIWVSDTGNNRVEEFNSAGTFVRVFGFGVTNGEAKFQICTASCKAGISGSGAGQFNSPEAIAIDTKGNVWVTDGHNHRLEEFTSAGAYIKTLGSLGSAGGQFNYPEGLTVDSHGNLWVDDSVNHRIQEFNESGTFVRTFGYGVSNGEAKLQVCTTACRAGVSGSGNGQFNAPADVAVDASGNVWVDDFGNYRIQEFNEKLEYVTKCGSQGSGEGQFQSAYRMSLAPEGNLWVSDGNNNRVEVISPSCSYVEQFGAAGTGAGQFKVTGGVSVRGVNAYVIDKLNSRLEKWSLYTSEGALRSPEPGTTIEYGVPVYGAGAPYQMTSTELAKWGEKEDLPAEATAVFPPDEPMGWPASDYKRAAITYLDNRVRAVNAASPTGGISTVEYNAFNEVTRSLSAANRATALKEGSKSAEVAEALSSKKIYNAEGTQVVEALGPEHKIRLAGGTEEQTRDHQQFFYNEEQPGGEAHNLQTKTKSWTETASKKVLESHEATTSYGGQSLLGWKLRKPTLVKGEVKGQTTTKTTTYEAATGEPKETFASLSVQAPIFVTPVRGFNQILSGPSDAAVDSSGNLWVSDRGHNAVEKFTSTGGFLASYGVEGTGTLQFKAPEGVAINQSTGNVYVTDSGNNRVQELSAAGNFVATYGFGVTNGETKYQTCTSGCRAGISGSGEGQFNDPLGVAVDGGGNVWVVDHANNRIEKFSSANGFLAKYGASGTGEVQFKEPAYVAVSGGNLYITDFGNARVEELSSAGAYVGEFGSSGSGNGQFVHPDGISANPSTGTLYVGDPTNWRVEQFSQSGVYLAQFGSHGVGNGQFQGLVGIASDAGNDIYAVDSVDREIQVWNTPSPVPIYTKQFANGDFANAVSDAVDAYGNVWVTNAYGNNIQKFAPSGTRIGSYSEFGSTSGKVSEPIGIAVNKSTGNVYVGDDHNNRIDEFNEKGEFVSAFGYGVINGAEALQICTTTCVAGLRGGHSGEFNEAGWLAIDSSGNIWVGDESNNRVQVFNNKDEFIHTFGFGVSNGAAEFQICATVCQAGIAGSGAGQFSSPSGVAIAGGHIYVGDLKNNRVEMFGSEGAYIGQFGSFGTGNGQFNHPKGVAVDGSGNVYVVDGHNSRIEEFTGVGTYRRTIGTKGTGNGQVNEAEGVAIDAAGDVYAVDTENNRLVEWAGAPSPGNEGAGNSRTTYYTAAANAEYANCGGHPEWATLVCQTEPIVQPGVSGLPALAVTTTTYNIWNEPETITEKIGSITRTRKKTYDGAGRQTSNEVTSTSGEEAALPAVGEEYSSETGALVKQNETLEGKAKSITSVYNTLGQLTSYTDAGGSLTKYTYDVDGRTEEVSDPKGRQVYSYDSTTGLLTKLFDTAAGTFTATYDVAGGMLTEGYPNGMTAKYTRNPIGKTTSLEYEKTTSCTEKCVWFSDSEAFGPKGELAYQTSTLSTENYTYNEAGQLSQAQETPVGKGCSTRLYAYDEESGQRESLTTREPNEKNECTTEGGVVEGHFYDTAARMQDPGMTYDAQGNVTKVPALDAGGSPITSSFYADNQVATQEQSEQTVGYVYDPSGRTMVATLKGKTSTTTSTSHYAGPGNALTWTCEEAGECKTEAESKWTRRIPGIDGSLDAIQTNAGTPVLQLHDLQDNIIGTASLSGTETKLLSTQNSTEFGVPVGTAPKYSWLGGEGAQSELGTGVITSGGSTYVPQLAQMLETEVVTPPGAAPGGVGETGVYLPSELSWANESGNEGASRTVAEQRALEAAALEAMLAGEGEDPTKYLTSYDALQKAKSLEKTSIFGEVAEIFGSLGSSAVELVVGVALDKFNGIDKVKEWYKNTVDLLRQCANDIETGSGELAKEQEWAEEHQTCRLETRDYKLEIHGIGGSIENFNWAARVSWCTNGRKQCYALHLPRKIEVLQ